MILKNKKITITAVIFFLVAMSYTTILNNSFIADDYYFYSPTITQNAFRFFLQDMVPADPSAVFLRPLTILTFALESHFQKIIPFLPHSTNLFFHVMNTALVGLLIMFHGQDGKITKRDIFAPAAGMLIFALHPQATGAVCWVSARFDLMCGLFGIMGIYAWLNSVSKSTVLRWRLTAIVAFTLSILSKETGIIFPSAVFLWELWRWIINRHSIKAKNQIVALSQIVTLILIYSVYRLFVLGGIGGYSIPEATGLYFNGPFGYILVMFWPFVKMGPVPSVILSSAIAIITIAIVATVSQEKTDHDSRRKCPWSLALFLTVLPIMLLVPHLKFLNIRQVLDHAEARLSYVSLIGFSIIIGCLLNKARDFRIGRVVIPVFLSLVLCFYVWAQQSEISRWTRASQTADTIINQTVALVPSPNDNATLIFHRIPLTSDRWYYVFGIGLSEAISQGYARLDLEVVRFPEENILENPPNNSYIFEFDYKNLKMELTHTP